MEAALGTFLKEGRGLSSGTEVSKGIPSFHWERRECAGCVQTQPLEGGPGDSGVDRKEPGTSCWHCATHGRLRIWDLKQVGTMALDSGLGRVPWRGGGCMNVSREAVLEY